jgi:hypothetical protein
MYPSIACIIYIIQYSKSKYLSPCLHCIISLAISNWQALIYHNMICIVLKSNRSLINPDASPSRQFFYETKCMKIYFMIQLSGCFIHAYDFPVNQNVQINKAPLSMNLEFSMCSVGKWWPNYFETYSWLSHRNLMLGEDLYWFPGLDAVCEPANLQ